jgi:hypothetical protein
MRQLAYFLSLLLVASCAEDTSSSTASVTGTVTAAGGAPVPEASVKVKDAVTLDLLGTATTDAQGNYSIGDLPLHRLLKIRIDGKVAAKPIKMSGWVTFDKPAKTTRHANLASTLVATFLCDAIGIVTDQPTIDGSLYDQYVDSFADPAMADPAGIDVGFSYEDIGVIEADATAQIMAEIGTNAEMMANLEQTATDALDQCPITTFEPYHVDPFHGRLVVTSHPAHQPIFINGVDSGEVTPKIFKEPPAGVTYDSGDMVTVRIGDDTSVPERKLSVRDHGATPVHLCERCLIPMPTGH